MDHHLEAKFARSGEYGYVTSCPSNLGTGMRASVMIRLPNLTGSDDIYAERAQAQPKEYWNDACPIEWYHQSCVGFKSYEKLSTTQWYCPLCREK